MYCIVAVIKLTMTKSVRTKEQTGSPTIDLPQVNRIRQASVRTILYTHRDQPKEAGPVQGKNQP